MEMILGFLPFIAFAVLGNYTSPIIALSVGAVIAVALVVRGYLTMNHRIKTLEVGTAILLAALATYTAVAVASLSLFAVRLCADGGLLLVVLFSIAIRRPFTLEYAREQVDKAYWDTPQFVRTNYIITAGWAVVFAIMVIVEAVILLYPQIPQFVGFAVIILALLGGFYFTTAYSGRAKATS